MRSLKMRSDKKSLKAVANKCSNKKKKMLDQKQSLRDTISETISFVIKGKLTPIKPVLIENKCDFVDKTTKKNSHCDKMTKKTNDMKPNKIIKRIVKQPAKVKTKVQIETAKKVNPPNSTKKGVEKRISETSLEAPKNILKKVNKKEPSVKNLRKKANLKTEKSQKGKDVSKSRNVSKPQKSKVQIKQEKLEEINHNISKELKSDTLKKQQTIDELLKQVNEEIRENKKSMKIKKEKNKSKNNSSCAEKLDTNPKKESISTNENELLKIKTEIPTESNISMQSVHQEKCDLMIADVNVELSTKIKSEPSSDKEDSAAKEKTLEDNQRETEAKTKTVKDKKAKKLVQISTEKQINRKKSHQKLKNNPKMTIMKKRVISSKNKNEEDKKCKTKLFGFWNGPKCHRVASLNALAKVHCLYENETRGNMLDIIDEKSKLSYAPRKDPVKSNKTVKIKEENENIESEASSPMPTRTLRSAPGLRGAGKHWDMHDESSSSEYLSDDYCSKPSVNYVKRDNHPKESEKQVLSDGKIKKTKKRCRRQNEIMMDLKDMVVKKRMASLNASAILAASYSLEKRQSKAMKSDDDSDSYDGSSEDYFAMSDTEIKREDEVKKEGDRKLIEVHTTPNKKVAVILNQDTDVTITGVYVNSTTRSTHHEGYCNIAGMQYRISATSHTQTAATAVATETLLHPSSTSTQDNTNSESLSTSSKSYTPLDALSNMQPPPGPGIQHNHPVVHNQPPMGPPQHVLPMPSHHSPGLRHSCSSAFSSPHSTPGYQISSGHHPPAESESNFVHAEYYQPAGPLITVSHGSGPTTTSHGQSPVPLSKATSLSEASPTSTTPSVTSTHDMPPPPPSSTGGDSSDSEVVITSVTSAKDSIPPPPPAHHSVSYRYGHHQYPAPPPNYSYTYHPPYTYHTAPPPHNPTYPPPPQPHDLCYSSYNTHKYVPSYRRYLASAQYYPAPQEIYSAVPPSAQSQQSQQMVSAPPSGSTVGGPGSYSSSGTAAAIHQPPTILETYTGPQSALVETYQPPPPPHYYPPPTGYAPPPSCYTHSPSRALPYISPTYQSCPCPMQSCPKNGLTGPLTGDSKRSSTTSITKDSMPLLPVALALPLEPNSVMGPPSPARGSAGMPPPPSPAGATYQAPPSITKQESQSPDNNENCKLDKKRKARVGKAMVRNNIAAGMQQNTMLLMCNPLSQDFPSTVKREIESPEEKAIIEDKKDICPFDEDTKAVTDNFSVPASSIEKDSEATGLKLNDALDHQISDDSTSQKESKLFESCSLPDTLPPVVSTVAENVKVKNMKRKLCLTKELPKEEKLSSFPKQQKTGSYKCLIKKETSYVKINNGKRKLIEESLVSEEVNQRRRSITKSKKPTTKRKLSSCKEDYNKRLKMSKTDELSENEGISKSTKKKVNSKIISSSSVTALDNLLTKNSIDRTIDSVVNEICNRTSSPVDIEIKSTKKCVKSNNEQSSNKSSTNNLKTVQSKVKSECKKIETRRKSKCIDVTATEMITKVPRRCLHTPRWSNGWRWEGEPYQSKVFINSDEMTAVRKCYPAMMHETGDKIFIRDCVLLKAGPRKNDLPFVAKIASLWENPEDGEMMMSLLWYYRPEHTEQGRMPTDQIDEVFASRHKDSNSVACIDDKCYVLTFNEYCRYRKKYKRLEEGIEEKTLPCIPNPEPYPRLHRQPPSSQISPEMIFFCRRVYDFRQKRIMKNPS